MIIKFIGTFLLPDFAKNSQNFLFHIFVNFPDLLWHFHISLADHRPQESVVFFGYSYSYDAPVRIQYTCSTAILYTRLLHYLGLARKY
jgi:hypothetical protein